MPTTSSSADALRTLRAGLTTIAVTGTNGKTSTTCMLAAIAEAAGQVPARVTTLGMWVGDTQVADDGSMASFVRTLEVAQHRGVKTLCLEVTSRALASGFADRFPADIAVFTNLSLDHLDRHGSAEAYLAAKARLFVGPAAPRVAVLNGIDPASALLHEVMSPATHSCAFARLDRVTNTQLPVALATETVTTGTAGLALKLCPSDLARALGMSLELHVLGEFQADNALGAALAASHAGFAPEAIRHGLRAFAGVPGRFDVIAQAPLTIVDFAHSPDALERALQAAQALSQARGGRLTCVFGCGGEREQSKRPLMGRVADRLCDRVFLTTDNPRAEAPERIAEMVHPGAVTAAAWRLQPDRAQAIAEALDQAGPKDVVVIAGRGHERHQWLAEGPVPSHDPDLVRRALGAAAGPAG